MGNFNSARRLNYLVPYSVFQFKKFKTQILGHSLYSKLFFYMIQKYFSEISWNWERENLISWGKGGTYSPEQLNYLVLPSVFQFLKFKELKIFIIYYISKSFTWFRITFLSFLEFPLIDEEGGPSFLGETNPAEWLNYLSPSSPSAFEF